MKDLMVLEYHYVKGMARVVDSFSFQIYCVDQ